jgi:uncharacterized delta-60 repeat protein
MSRSRKSRLPVRIDQLESRQLFAAGALDISYSSDGKHTISLPNGQTMDAADVAVQKDGKTVIVGTMKGKNNRTDFSVARLNIDGTLDLSFNANGADGPGYTRTPVGDKARANGAAVAIQADGKIVVVGTAEISSGFDEPEFAIVRYNADGLLDKSFDGDGMRAIDLGNFSSFTRGYDVAIQPDGKIVAVGMTYRAPDEDFFIIRLNSDGKLDAKFDFDGKKFIGFGDDDEAKVVKLDTNGTIVVAGHASSSAGLAKLTSTGLMVDEFDSDGKRSFAIPGAIDTRVADMLLQSDGRVVIVGHVDRVNAQSDMYIARFNRNGTLDTTFGTRGTGFDFVDFGGNDFAGGIVKAPDGGTGFIITGTSGGFASAKFTENGLIDTTFGTQGKVRLNFGGNARVASGPGKRITLAGGGLFASARLLDKGSNVVNAGSFQPNAFEQGVRPSGFIVTRSERLPVATRVFFSVTGTASTGKLFLPSQGNPNDYTLTNMVVPIAPIVIGGGNTTPYVDIPAGETFVGVTLTPIDDTRAEGNETAIFKILSSSTYDIGSNKGTEITIFDNDLKTLNATADAYVRDGADASKNFGSATELQVKNSGTGFNRQAYFKFDIGSLSTINSVKLRLFGSLSNTARTNVAASVFAVDNTSWSETGLTFNNKPANSASALGGLTVLDATGRFYEVDLTSYIRAQKAAGKTAVSFMLKANVSVDPFIRFNSREAGNGPQLLVT